MSGSGLKFKEMMGLVGPEGSEAKRSEADRSLLTIHADRGSSMEVQVRGDVLE